MKELKNNLIGKEKKENKILLLERRGCNFWNNEPVKERSDFDNYRYHIYNLFLYKKYQSIKDFKRCCVEISRGCINKYIKCDKNRPKDNALVMNFYLYKNDGTCWGMSPKTENLLYDYKNSYFTSEYVLSIINKISKIKYNKMLLINSLENIEKNLGYREKAIFENLAFLKEFKTTEEHQAFYFYDNDNNYFVYDFKNNNVIG